MRKIVIGHKEYAKKEYGILICNRVFTSSVPHQTIFDIITNFLCGLLIISILKSKQNEGLQR